jgi:hypothetical protein
VVVFAEVFVMRVARLIGLANLTTVSSALHPPAPGPRGGRADAETVD